MNKNKNKFNGENVALAISGGADSTALAFLLNKFKNKYNYNITSFTLDHQLRKESAKETKFVKKTMNGLNIKHHSLVWSAEKPKTRIQETARIARYDILAKACRIHNCKYVFLGHHADDQVETFIIRLGAKSGLDGLGCMQETSRILTSSGTIELIRPLLNYKKDNLIKICLSNQLKWIEDPSNLDMKYLRSKVRKLIVHQSMYRDFSNSIKLFRSLSKNLNCYIHNFMKNDIQFNLLGICQFNMDKFIELPKIFQVKVLSYLIKITGGKKYPRKTKILNNLLDNINSKKTKNTTVGGTYIKIDENKIVLYRQLDNTIKKIDLKNGITVWDRRFIITNKTKKLNLTVGPLGEKDYLLMIKLNKIKKPSINFNAIKTIPAIRVLEQIVSIPHLLYWKCDFWKNNININHIEEKLLSEYKNIDIYKSGEKI
ncbi:MAG: tRNA lysidine(34) synthetase TilS [Alphaproteobacteria bacterium]|nr:tRNA lysidine(34) synthetase TilS [Alphaproteobacteria bacterium]